MGRRNHSRGQHPLTFREQLRRSCHRFRDGRGCTPLRRLMRPNGPRGADANMTQTIASHRMYLWFFEHVLQDAAGDPSLRLPYWDYETNAALPAAFVPQLTL